MHEINGPSLEDVAVGREVVGVEDDLVASLVEPRVDPGTAQLVEQDRRRVADEGLPCGGPERDPRGLDPDGDGFACDWDPAPFRAAVSG